MTDPYVWFIDFPEEEKYYLHSKKNFALDVMLKYVQEDDRRWIWTDNQPETGFKVITDDEEIEISLVQLIRSND